MEEEASLLPEIIISESLKSWAVLSERESCRFRLFYDYSFNNSSSSKATVHRVLSYLNLTETGGCNEKAQSSLILTK